MRNLFILALLSFLPLICNAKGLSVEKKETLAAIAKNDTIRLWNINENHSCELAQMPKEEVEFYLEEVYKNYRLRYKTLVKTKIKRAFGLCTTKWETSLKESLSLKSIVIKN